MSSLRLPCFSPVPSQLLTPNDYPTQLLGLLAPASRQPVGKMTLAHFLKSVILLTYIYHGVMSFLRCCIILTEWLPSPISHRHHLWSSVIATWKYKAETFPNRWSCFGAPSFGNIGSRGQSWKCIGAKS